MGKEKLNIELLDFYYGESKHDLAAIANKYGVSLDECQEQLNQFTTISQKFQELPEHQSSQISLNKITVHARDKAAQAKRHPLWRFFLNPAYGLSMVLVAGVFSFFTWQMHNKPTQTQIAITQPVGPNATISRTVKERLLTTPFDQTPVSTHYRLPKFKRFLNNNVSNVSLGNGQSDAYDLDDDIDIKLDPRKLTIHDLETLYFRARKLEKLGYYKRALHDYIFIAKFYPHFENYQVLPIAIARCYEQMGNKKAALSVLDSYQKTYGGSEDIKFWIDHLKSETF